MEREYLSSSWTKVNSPMHSAIKSETQQYSWWSYRANARANNKGWRLDYNMVSNTLKDKIQRAIILPEAMHSDHCPVMVELDL